MFYTYLWLRVDGTPYYVGKGCKRRGLRSYAHNVNCPKDKERILIQEWPSEQDAFAAEIFLISFYGRKDLKTGVLLNRTDGGQGMSGYRHTEETKALLSKLKTGTTHKSYPCSAEIKLHLRTVLRPQICQRGHTLTDETVYVRKDTGRRQCKECCRQRTKNWQKRKLPCRLSAR